MYIANAGDCRAVLVSGSSYERLTVDHKVTEKGEAARLREEGCNVVGGRIQMPSGDINVARAFGDRRFLPHVHSTPDVIERRLTYAPRQKPARTQSNLVHHQRTDDHFLVLACDGIWDTTQDSWAADQMRKLPDPKRLCSLAYTLGSHDNLSAIVVSLQDEPVSRRASPVPNSGALDTMRPRYPNSSPDGSDELARPWAFGRVG